jgi:hypothetical protein
MARLAALDLDGIAGLTAEAGQALMEKFGVRLQYLKGLNPETLHFQRESAFLYEIAVRLLAPDLIPISWGTFAAHLDQSNIYR